MFCLILSKLSPQNCSSGSPTPLAALLWLRFALLLATVPLVAHSSLSVGTGGEAVGRQLSFPYMAPPSWSLPGHCLEPYGVRMYFNEGLK